MFIYALRRILFTVPIALGVSIVCFGLIHISPGDPLSAVLPEGASPEMIAQVREAYGFDQPLVVQYLKWLGLVLHGDFGLSIVNRRPVLDEVMTAAGNTLILGGAAIAMGFVAGTAMGLIAGYAAGTAKDKVVTAVAISGVSIPHYWLGIVLVIIFAVNLNLLPATGMGSSGTGGFTLDWAGIRHLILPAVALAVIPGSIIARSVRGTVADVRKQEFVQTIGHSEPSPCDADMQDALRQAAQELCPGQWQALPSGAIHDSQILARLMPVGMLFVPSIDGISHHYLEDTSPDDLCLGLQVLARAVERLLAS